MLKKGRQGETKCCFDNRCKLCGRPDPASRARPATATSQAITGQSPAPDRAGSSPPPSAFAPNTATKSPANPMLGQGSETGCVGASNGPRIAPPAVATSARRYGDLETHGPPPHALMRRRANAPAPLAGFATSTGVWVTSRPVAASRYVYSTDSKTAESATVPTKRPSLRPAADCAHSDHGGAARPFHSEGSARAGRHRDHPETVLGVALRSRYLAAYGA